MFPANFLALERIGCKVDASSKKKVLEELGKLFEGSAPGLTQDAVFDRLLERERLGSTGLGYGIALPHARVPDLEQAHGAFIQLSAGVDFDAIDNQPVDLVFALLVPEVATQEHLQLLAGLATLFSQAAFCERLRRAEDRQTLLELLANQELTQVGA
jgi:PTS system nitrogen regulatory IIA component